MSSVGKEIAKGTVYNAFAKYASVIINLIVTAILARILTPSDFGAVALTTVFIMFFDLLGNMGFGPAIIQNKNLNNKDIASIFNLTIIIAIVFATICYFSSGLVANYYHNAVLTSIMRLLSLQVLFTILNVVPYSLLLKNKEFKYISIATVSSNIAFGVIAVVAAFNGLGLYSLLITPIFSVLTLFVLYSIKSTKLYGTYYMSVLSGKSIKKVLSFSIYQFLFNLVNYFSRNLDKIIVGRQFSMSDLGYYEKSYRLMTLPISNISSVLTPSVQPVLSQFQDDKDRLKGYVSSIYKLLSFIGCVLTPYLFFAAREIILIVFGNQWEPAVPIFQILSLSVFIQIIDSVSGSILQSANAPKYLFVSGLICAIINIISIVAGVYVWGTLNGLAVLLDIAFFLNLVVDLYYIFYVVLKTSISDVFEIFKHSLAILLLMGVCLFAVSILPINNYIYSFVLKSTIMGLCALVYIRISRIFDYDTIKRIIKHK